MTAAGVTSSGPDRGTGPTEQAGGTASIGSVLDALRADFPEITISKIRFLESEGLISPARTPSGYRQFSAADVARLPADRGTPVAIYCKSGRMSAIAATELDRLGYRDVVELRGGMDAWTQQGFLLRDTPVQGAPPASAPAVG